MSAFVRSKRTTSGIRLAAPSLESYTADSRRRYSWEAFHSIQLSSAYDDGTPPSKGIQLAGGGTFYDVNIRLDDFFPKESTEAKSLHEYGGNGRQQEA